MPENKQTNETEKEHKNSFAVKKKTKQIWLVGILVILIGIGWIVFIGPTFECIDRGKSCVFIKGEVLEEGVLTMGTGGGLIKTDINCQTSQDCPRQVPGFTGGGSIDCLNGTCQYIPSVRVPLPNTYSVKVLKVYHGDVKKGQEIAVNNYKQSFVEDNLEVGKVYKIMLLIDTPTKITEGFLFDSQKKSIYEYFTGQYQLALYFGFYQGKQLIEPWHVLTTLPVMLIVLIATIFLVKESILIRLITAGFVVWFVLPLVISNLYIMLISSIIVFITSIWCKRKIQ